MQAPHFIAKESPETNFQEQHAWWLKTKEFPGINFAANFDRTLDYLNKIFLYKGPFDGVFGFSQGGGKLIYSKKAKNLKFKNCI